MNESWTIILPAGSFGKVAEAVRRLHSAAVAENSGESWSTLRVPLRDTELVITGLERTTSGDRFSKLILGMHNFARKLTAESDGARQRVLDSVGRAQLLLGVVATPRTSENIEAAVFRLAKELDGIVFTGNAFCESEGALLLGG